ncbi:unnamed protein product [Cylindrotheca closterium]|uniref:Uncharacterized protein n=1 Tax=Cylindrotheca closterium TaxID=2856 RepID=A0AAD2CL62_9STRA|nr:unnamed protein product [Cylindrotheca closterium]
MTKVGSNVEKFNLHVSEQLENLAHYGEESKDVLIHLFEGYKAASDKSFVSYIERKEEKHEDNSEPTNEPRLMQDAENYYKNRVWDQTWNRPDENQQAILSLKAEFKQIKNSKKPESGKKKDNDKKSGGGKNRGKGKNNNRQKSSNVPAWKTTAPKAEDKLKAKYVDGDSKPWYWCEALKKYCRHTPDQCNQDQNKDNKKNKIKLRAAMAENYAPSDSDTDEE